VSQPARDDFARLTRSAWRSAWPCWLLLLFASLAIARLLPAGYVRAVVAAPVLLIVPGSVTLGAVFFRRQRPSGTAFVCWAALLSVAWSVFATLALYVIHVKITAVSTYVCLLIVTAALAIVAQARLMLESRGTRVPEAADPDLSEAEAAEDNQATRLVAVRGSRYYAIAAVLAGMALLGGGVYAQDHLPHPAPVGYTWLAWAGPRVQGVLPVGPLGTKLTFQIVHHETGTARFELTAAWLGSRPRTMAGPLSVTVGPNRTYHGTLLVPPLPDGCTYRIVLTLASSRGAGPPASSPRTWSINADVYQPGKSQKKCR
jgi:hypothetical protein